ncbi:MAG: aspartyl protease family protein [Chloroflexi bacterium]|nr:aspartyl protease family protein [Chloroflexota bacterium]
MNLEIGDPQGEHYETVEALVDTGATYTTVPASLLERLGGTPHTIGVFLLADGTRVEREIGRTWVRLEGVADVVPVVFGDETVRPLMGAVTLEIFRLGVDPVGRRLIPVPGLLMTEGVA